MTLQELIEDLGYETRSYSGRGMYGRECLGVTVEDPISFTLELGYAIGQEETSELPRRTSWDSMGLDYIVYFPNVPYDGEDEDEDED